MRVPAILWVVAAIGVVPAGVPTQSNDRLPPGWSRRGPQPSTGGYTFAVDTVIKRSGAASLRIESTPDARPSTSVMQSFDATPYRGTRLRLRGHARTARVARWAGLLMRIDSPTVTVFDNMQRRPLQGTRNWTEAEIVLDVPNDAYGVSIGAILLGSGTLWLDDFEVDTVPRSVATTGTPAPREAPGSSPSGLPRAPANLRFEPN